MVLYYNGSMKEQGSEIDIVTVLRLAVSLWLAYLLALVAIDHFFYPRPIFPLYYYLISGLDALVVLGLVLWPQGRMWFGRALLPCVIVLMSVIPLVAGHMMLLPLPPTPANDPEAMLLRLMPLLLMALILTAWQYRWSHVLLFSLGIVGLSLLLQLLYYRPGVSPLLPLVTILIIQVITFLTVGYFINVLMTRLKQQQHALEQAHDRLVHYAGTLEELTISRERNRLARELHDTLAHTLSALSVQLETVKAYWEVDPPIAQEMLDKSLVATRSGLQETRRALKALRATPLEDLGMLLALRQLAEESATRANVQLSLSLPAQLPPLSPAVEQVVYRIAQEALANVIHHANARTLTVLLKVDTAILSLMVKDDGVGFTSQLRTVGGHFGLSGMQERADLVGGQVHIASNPGKGTTVRFMVNI